MITYSASCETRVKDKYKCSDWRWNTHTHPFNGPLSGTTRVSRYQKSKTNLDFTEARGSEWQWHQLGHMQVCSSLQTDNHASTPPLSFLQAGCPSCRPTNSVKALKATDWRWNMAEKANIVAIRSDCLHTIVNQTSMQIATKYNK